VIKHNPFKKIQRPIMALTGGIASGKTTVAREFEKLGAVIIDSDALARKVCAKGSPALVRIVKYFGAKILKKDGTLNRSKLGSIVFSDDIKRKKLENIVHPYVVKAAVLKVEKPGAGKCVIFDVPLLYETGLDLYMDKVIVVWATEKQQLRRLKIRDGMAGLDASLRICSQIPISIKKKKADFVIDNSGSKASAKQDVKKIWEVLTKKAK
jgi:dephospho-CoA kinase